MQFTYSHASPVQRNPSDSFCECLERLLSSLDQWRLHRPFSITAPSGMLDFIKHFPSRSIRPRLQEKYISFPNNLSSSSKINKLTLATEHLSCLGKYTSDQYKIFHLATASQFLSNFHSAFRIQRENQGISIIRAQPTLCHKHTFVIVIY